MVKLYPLLKPLTDQPMEEVRAYGILEVSLEQYQTVCNSIVRFAQSSQVDSYSPELMDSYKDNLDTRCSSGEICKEYHRFQLRVIRMLSSFAERGVVDFSSTKPHPLKYIVSDATNSLVEMILDSYPISIATKNDLRAPTRHFLWYAEQLGIKPQFIDDIAEFMAWLKSERNNVAPTINHRLSDLRGFCRYLYKKNAISLDEYEAIREISDVDDERVIDFTWLSANDVHLVLKSTDSNREAIRDRFLLSLLYESGARINEVLSLKLLDVKATSNREADVHFYGKGKKHRITPLSREIWNQFEDYCEKYHPDKTSENLLFYSFRNGRRNKMSSDNVSRILAGCEEEVRKSNPDLIHLHSHLFRRTRAMHLYQAGVPLPTISEWLGHSNIETTRFYAKVTEEMKRDALHKLSDSDSSVFKDDVVFKYANDEDAIKRLCGLK